MNFMTLLLIALDIGPGEYGSFLNLILSQDTPPQFGFYPGQMLYILKTFLFPLKSKIQWEKEPLLHAAVVLA